MDEAFDQAVKVHRILGEPAESGISQAASGFARRFRRRLVQRAHALSESLVDQATPTPEPTDTLDETLDDELFHPARRSITQRTVALERWLADHGYRGGRPIRFTRGHRPLAYHGHSFNLPTARPVFRDDFSPADELLADRVLDGIQHPGSGLGGVHRRPATQQSGRVSVLPGFLLLELTPTEFSLQFGIAQDTQFHGHVAVGQLPAGPVLVTTRDHTGEMLAHALLREYAHELAAVGDYQHRHSLASPNQLIQQPGQFHALPDRFANVDQLDQLAHQLLAERARHLAHDCRMDWPLTLSDLGFASDDWVPLSHPYPLDDRFVAFAATYLASILLGRTLVSALNHHPDALPLAPFFPRQAFADIDCRDGWHPHYAHAHQYVNFVRATQAGQLGARALDDLYSRLIDPAIDFHNSLSTHRPVRLHAYRAPLHSPFES